MEDILNKLLQFTGGCREDMHEPDEQGISARVIGTQLDNTMGCYVKDSMIIEGTNELVVILENKPEGTKALFNLADLIALARKAKLD